MTLSLGLCACGGGDDGPAAVAPVEVTIDFDRTPTVTTDPVVLIRGRTFIPAGTDTSAFCPTEGFPFGLPPGVAPVRPLGDYSFKWLNVTTGLTGSVNRLSYPICYEEPYLDWMAYVAVEVGENRIRVTMTDAARSSQAETTVTRRLAPTPAPQ